MNDKTKVTLSIPAIVGGLFIVIMILVIAIIGGMVWLSAAGW